LESSRCSCSLCSSQGAGRYRRTHRVTVEVMCTLRRRTQKEAAMEAAPSKRNSDDR
jgi:hypothetical protein